MSWPSCHATGRLRDGTAINAAPQRFLREIVRAGGQPHRLWSATVRLDGLPFRARAYTATLSLIASFGA
jgi:hypothetical protein